MKVLIFGTGNIAEKIIVGVENDYEVVGFVDNSIKKKHTFWDEEKKYYIYAPSEIDSLEFEKVIIASTKYASEMFSQLLGLGVREHDIIVDYVCGTTSAYLYDLLKMQTDMQGDYNRADIVVKYMAIRSYENGDNEGIELYIKMQKKRLGISEEEAKTTWEKFRTLIDSVRENGYDVNSQITCDERLRVMDGAHRIAICLYFKVYKISVRLTPQNYECNYGINWFWEKGFSRKEIDAIRIAENSMHIEKEEILAVIWPSAIRFAEEIKKDLEYFAEITNVESRTFNEIDDFQHFVRGVYAVDDIEAWKIEKKIEYMKSDELKVEILTLRIDNPRYRVKAVSKMPISMTVEQIKKIIRSRYNKKMENYYYDNIIHIADNYFQSEVMKKILDVVYDISAFFRMIADKKYALTKIEVPYMPLSFPRKYPIHKDMDMLCIKEDFEDVVRKCKMFLDGYIKKNELQLIEKKEESRTKLRVEYLNFLIYQFDISTEIEKLSYDFVKKAIEEREKRGEFYILSEENEIIVRRNELERYPEKVHHRDYLEKRKGIICY